MRNTEQANVKVNLEARQAEEQLEKLNSRSEELRKEMDRLRKANDKAGFDKAAKELKQVQKEAKKLKEETVDVNRVMNNLNGVSYNELLRTKRKLIKEMRNVKDKGSEAYLTLKERVKQLNTELNQVNEDMRDSTPLIDRANNAFNNYSGMILAAVAAAASFILALREMSDLIMNFEKGFTNVKTLLSTEDLEQYSAELEKGAIETVKKYGFAVDDVNKSLFDTISAGVPAANAVRVMDEASRLAIGGVTQLSVATDGMTTVMNAWKLEMSEAEQVSSAFFSAQKAGKTTVEELAVNIGKVAPIAAQANISYQETLSMLAELTKGGISTAEATTYLKSAISSLINPSNDAKKVLQKFGVPFGTTAIRAQGFTKVLEKLNGVIRTSPDEISKAISSVEALTAVSVLSGEGLKDYQQILQSVNTDYGEGSSLSAAFAMQQETTEQTMKRASAALKAMVLELKESFSPVLKSIFNLVSKGSNLIKKTIVTLGQNKDAIVQVTKVIAVAIATMASYTAAVKLATVANKALRTGTALLSAAQALLTGNVRKATRIMRLFNLSVKMNPVGLLVTVVTAAAAAFVAFREEAKKAGDITRVIGNVYKEAASQFEENKTRLDNYREALIRTKPHSQERIDLIKEVKRQYPGLLKNIDAEAAGMDGLSKAFSNYAEKLRETIKLRVLDRQFAKTYTDERELDRQVESGDLNNNEAYAQKLRLKEKREALKAELDYQSDLVRYNERIAGLLKEKRALEAKFANPLMEETQGMLLSFDEFVALNRHQQKFLNASEKDLETAYSAYVHNTGKARQAAEYERRKLERINKELEEYFNKGPKNDGEDENRPPKDPGGNATEGDKKEDPRLTALKRLVRETEKHNSRLELKRLEQNERELEQIRRKYADELAIAKAGAARKDKYSLAHKLQLAELETMLDEELKAKKLEQEERFQKAILAARRKYGVIDDAEKKQMELDALKRDYDNKLLTYKEYLKAKLAIHAKYAPKDEKEQAELEALQLEYENRLISYEEFERMKAEIHARYADARAKKEKDTAKSNMDALKKSVQQQQYITQTFSDFFSSAKERELQAAGDSEKKKKEIRKKYALPEFIIAASEIAAQTALGIMKAVSMFPPTGLPFSAIVGAMGAMQLAAVGAEKQKVAGLEKGGRFPVTRAQDNRSFLSTYGGTQRGYFSRPTVLVGEGGPEYVVSGHALANPVVRDLTDIVESARINGQLHELDYNNVIAGLQKVQGYESGGYIKTPAGQNALANTSAPATKDDLETVLKLVMESNEANRQMIHNLKVHVNAREVKEENDRYAEIEGRADA